MSILIDTQVFLWAGGVEKRLSRAATDLLQDPNVPIFLSTVTAWEISIKWAKKRLELPVHPYDFVKRTMEAGSISQLMITLVDACSAGDLPPHHKDPFDRLLVAQARNNGLRLMTSDTTLEKYDVDVIALWLDDDE
ncbi:MAG: type II toxin-antitoxin system VapC family toxin [Acidobacteria bacterium]|nr:type II toxin-antitoxin system VapC family toxin [Acidobacteriota bacterium]